VYGGGVVCSIQGSFAPPHLGHKRAGIIFANALLKLYPAAGPIKVLYMPSSQIGSKSSFSRKTRGPEPSKNSLTTDVVGEVERLEALRLYSNQLNKEFEKTAVRFEASPIEYENSPIVGNTSTYPTILKLKEKYPGHKVVLAMGIDNARQLLWWNNVQELPKLLDAMLLVDRDLTEEELSTTIYYKSDIHLVTGQEMSFIANAPWETTLNGIKKKWSAENILKDVESIKTPVVDLLQKKTYLLGKPGNYSSTDLRRALAVDNVGEVRRIAGDELAEYYMGLGIGKRTLMDVKKLPLGYGEKPLHTLVGGGRKSQKRKRQRKNRSNRKTRGR
jgi:nicotinic acid mononucleotide adenylyltransferase